MTIGLAKEVAGEGIRVNAVRPGLVGTEIHASSGQPDRVERVKASVPMARAGHPDEIANAIAWLCSDEASYVTGAVLDVAEGGDPGAPDLAERLVPPAPQDGARGTDDAGAGRVERPCPSEIEALTS